MPDFTNFTKMRLTDVEIGDVVLWDYKEYSSKKQVFATVVGLTPGAKRFLVARTIHIMVSGPGRATMTDDRASTSMIWVQNRPPEL